VSLRQLSSPSLPHLPVWQSDYDSVLTETDTDTLFKRVEIAEAAILTRRDILHAGSECRSELQAIAEALENLRVIKRDQLKFI